MEIVNEFVCMKHVNLMVPTFDEHIKSTINLKTF